MTRRTDEFATATRYHMLSMGLSIYYRYQAKVNADGARSLVERLHAFVATLPFDDVSPVLEYDPPDGRCVFERGDEGPREFKPGGRYLTRKRGDGLEELVHVPPLHVICFHANLRGSETASFGLASHPPVIVHREDVVSHPPGCGEERRIGAGAPVEFTTRLRGWYSWSNGCKTQYAAHPKHGGAANFLRAHLSVFEAMDEVSRLGMKGHVRDDGKYWRHRSEQKLLAELAKWDELIAGFAGRLSDALGDAPGTVVAPIKDRPDFEHLEAKGDRRLSDINQRKPRPRRKNSP